MIGEEEEHYYYYQYTTLKGNYSLDIVNKTINVDSTTDNYINLSDSNFTLTKDSTGVTGTDKTTFISSLTYEVDDEIFEISTDNKLTVKDDFKNNMSSNSVTQEIIIKKDVYSQETPSQKLYTMTFNFEITITKN